MEGQNKTYDIDAILDELQNKAKQDEPEDVQPKKKAVFQLNLDLDSEYGEAVETAPIVREETAAPEENELSSQTDEPVRIEEEEEELQEEPIRPRSRVYEYIMTILYAVGVLLISGTLAIALIKGGADFTGLDNPKKITVDVTIAEGASTQMVAELLNTKGLVTQPFLFRVYAKLNGLDDKWQPGEFSLDMDMGYKELVNTLLVAKPRSTVKVLIPEGFTINKIAKRLEEKGVCSEADFYYAITEIDYSKDYDFIKASSKTKGYDSRIYKLEGFLFPDTYEFYENCSGETVVRKMLDNFDKRLDTTVRSAMSARNMTMDELIILASIVQGEAATRDDMQKVSRVLYNRLNNPENFPKLQCDSTRDYINKLLGGTNLDVSNASYDTYVKDGLPVGAINNPGLDAIKAVLLPSEDTATMDCYYFATDYKTGKTYFSKTLAQHENICKRYGIGMYG